MRLRGLTLSLTLLLCACSQPGSAGNDSAPANSGGEAPLQDSAGGEASTDGRQPASGSANSEPSAQVTLSARPAEVAEGATVTLMLANGSSEPIGYNLCSSGLRTSGGRPVPTASICTMELRTLKPGGAADYRYALPVNMADGSYSFLTQVEGMGSGRRSAVRSNSFEVRRRSGP